MRIIILIFCFLFIGNKPKPKEKFDTFGLPQILSTDVILKHKYYYVCYDCRYNRPEWVYYKLTNEMIQHNFDRQNDFRNDPLLTQCDVTSDDYAKSGLDRGHLCSSEDMAFDKEAISESFFMSNMCAQEPGFNRGIWKSLETKVRNWAIDNKVIYVVTGTILDKNNLKTIGPNKISVPKYCFKAVLDYKQPDLKTIAFIMENTSSDKEIRSFAISIDSLEKVLKIDLFNALPDSIENRIESKVDLNKWFKN